MKKISRIMKLVEHNQTLIFFLHYILHLSKAVKNLQKMFFTFEYSQMVIH